MPQLFRFLEFSALLGGAEPPRDKCAGQETNVTLLLLQEIRFLIIGDGGWVGVQPSHRA